MVTIGLNHEGHDEHERTIALLIFVNFVSFVVRRNERLASIADASLKKGDRQQIEPLRPLCLRGENVLPDCSRITAR